MHHPASPPPLRAVDPVSTWVLVTPAMATTWLNQNENNRPINDDRVTAYAKAMREGRWRRSHQGIGFDRTGRLIDGQHRLFAVVECGVAVWMLVTTGLEPEAAQVVDTGRVRTVAETIRREAGVTFARHLTSWCAVERMLTDNKRCQTTYDDVESYRARNAPALEVILPLFPLSKARMRTAPVWGAFVYAHAGAPAAVEAFVRTYCEDAGAPGSPVRLLVGLALDGEPDHTAVGRQTTALKTLRALQLEITGAKSTKLVAVRGALEYFDRLREVATHPEALVRNARTARHHAAPRASVA